MKVRLHPRARTELREAVSWYEDRRAGLGSDLADEVTHLLLAISRSPERWPTWAADRPVRRAPLQRFPYSVVFLVRAEAVVVVAVAHQRRRPGYWRARIDAGP